MRRRIDSRRGSTMIEFTLIGIPLMFVLISIFEISRGMWIYHTLAYAVRDASRFAIVHGQSCSESPNQCQVTVAQIAGVIRDSGVGLMPNELFISMETASGTIVNGGSQIPETRLDVLLANNSFWPTGPGSARPNNVVIRGRYQFRSALAFFWPGAGPGFQLGTLHLFASSREKIQF